MSRRVTDCHPGDPIRLLDPETGEVLECVVAWPGGRRTQPAVRVLGRWLGADTETHPIHVPRDTEEHE